MADLKELINKNLAENKAMLTKLMEEFDKPRGRPSRERMKLVASADDETSKKVLKQFIEVRRNPGRKVKEGSGTSCEETTFETLPLKVKLRANMKRCYLEEDGNDGEVEWHTQTRKRSRLSAALVEIIKAEDITESQLNRVLIDPRIKKSYTGANLSTCHQCRQKTQDMKTICRSGYCRGVVGQFCGVCLYNRYGENAREALLDDKWSCPVCRNICNCSFCLPKKGKRCTGILVPEARKHGFTNVRDFLDSLDKNENKEEVTDDMNVSKDGDMSRSEVNKVSDEKSSSDDGDLNKSNVNEVADDNNNSSDGDLNKSKVTNVYDETSSSNSGDLRKTVVKEEVNSDSNILNVEN